LSSYHHANGHTNGEGDQAFESPEVKVLAALGLLADISGGEKRLISRGAPGHEEVMLLIGTGAAAGMRAL